jgi:DNA replication regulator SLD3
LVARLDSTCTLFAIERESQGLYVLFQLGSWISLQQLRASAVASKQDVSKPLSLVQNGETSVPIDTPESSNYSNKKRLAIEQIQSMVKRPSTSLSTDNSQGTNTPVETPVLQPHALGVPVDSPPVVELATQPTAAEIFENIRNQYLEALYISKVGILLN